MKSKILILFCGGTIIMKKGKDGALVPIEDRDDAIKTLMNLEPRIKELADIDLKFIADMDSTNMTPAEWDQIIDAIAENYDNYDGFVITHGTDTMAYTASALSIALQNLGKPVILTGSQIPALELHTDARRNFVNAVRVATMDISGVYIVFDERIILGARATKASESKLDAFQTVNDYDAGEIRIDIQLRPNVPRKHNGKLKVVKGFEPDIFVTSLTPGQDVKDLEFLLDNDRIRGIIIKAFGTGNLPYNFGNFFKKAREKKVPIVVTSQCLHGMTKMEEYDVGKKALELGAIEGHDQSLEMLAVKLMWALKHHGYEEIKEVINTNFVGELKKRKQARKQ